MFVGTIEPAQTKEYIFLQVLRLLSKSFPLLTMLECTKRELSVSERLEGLAIYLILDQNFLK
jgi:hypothetical protein